MFDWVLYEPLSMEREAFLTVLAYTNSITNTWELPETLSQISVKLISYVTEEIQVRWTNNSSFLEKQKYFRQKPQNHC